MCSIRASKPDMQPTVNKKGLGLMPIPTDSKKMKMQILPEFQTEMIHGGTGGGWAFPSLTSKTSTMEINNLISQSNVGSAWASTVSAGSTGGYKSWKMPSMGGGAGADATNIQKNILNLTNFGFSFNV